MCLFLELLWSAPEILRAEVDGGATAEADIYRFAERHDFIVSSPVNFSDLCLEDCRYCQNSDLTIRCVLRTYLKFDIVT